MRRVLLNLVRPVAHSILSPSRFPDQRWHIAPAAIALAEQIAQETDLSPLLAQVLLNRGLETPQQVQEFLHPETQVLPSPLEDFEDLPLSLELLINAINRQAPIVICGDYDADGMTSTALLIRALRCLGAKVDYAIPSRMKEGYGINCRMVEEFHAEGVELILTVDNGIAAHEPIARARELGLTVIITDHHEVPPECPNANAILNPKLIPEDSPYRGLAGVGVAYVLATCLAQSLGKLRELGNSLVELFTLGTIADLAPLTGVNRRWVRRGLQRLPNSTLAGVQALIQVAGLSGAKDLKPEAIGFRLGPRINAVGRLADPQIVIELLTTDDPGLALERAMQCEQINLQRQKLCEQIEQEAIAVCEQSPQQAQDDRILVVVQPHWHHGVIGIVASRLVERYGVPVFIGTYEEDDPSKIRGSARSIPEFHIFEALEFCHDLLGKFGGHRAAGGFSMPTENLPALRSRLSEFAHQSLQLEHLKPLVTIDAEATLAQIDFSLFSQIDGLQPCGMGNSAPVFWSANVRVVEQKVIGKGHLKLTLRQETGAESRSMAAIAWRWGEYYPLPSHVDVAYRVQTNEWNGEVSLQLELIGLRLPTAPALKPAIKPAIKPLVPLLDAPLDAPLDSTAATPFVHRDRAYTCSLIAQAGARELHIHNDQGNLLVIQQGQKIGTLDRQGQSVAIDVTQPHYYHLIKAALEVLPSA